MPINNPDTIINWRKAKFYTVLDIANSPLKDLLIEEMKKLNGATSNMANKENPFSEPFPKGRNLGMNQGIDKKEEETEALVIKNEEEKINPFTN